MPVSTTPPTAATIVSIGSAVSDRSTAVDSSALPKKFGRNVIMNYVAQVVAAVAAIVITPLLLKHLGQSLFGVWILASSVVMYLQLFAAGFGGATTRLVAEDAAERPEVAVRTLNTTFFVLLPMGALALVAGIVLAFFFPSIVHVNPGMRTEVVIAVAVLAVAAAAALPADTFGGALLGHQRFDLLSISNALLVATTTAAGILIVVNGGGIVPLAVATTVISLSFHFVRYGMLRHIEPTTRIRRRLIDRVQLRRVTHLSGWFLLLAVLTAIYNTLCDVLIVGIVAGVKAAAVYGVGSRLAKAAMQALDSMAQVFFPYASHTARNDSPDALGAIAIDGTRVTLLGGTMAAIVFAVLAAPGIEAWVGPGYATSAQVLVVLAIALALGSPFRALGNIMTGAGDLRALTFVRAGEVIINLTLSVILVIAMGPLGAAFGTLGGVLLFRLPVGMILGCRAVGLPVRTLVRRAVVPHILPSIVSIAVLLALFTTAEASVVGLFVAAAAGCISYLAVYYVTGATPGDRERVLGYWHALAALRRRRGAKAAVPSADVGSR
jgi:O-antigen/teichoic acid export membrane protein